MKRFTKSWYRLQAYGVMGRIPGTDNDARVIVTKSNIQQAGHILYNLGYTENLRTVPMGKIIEMSANQAQQVNTFTPDYF